MVSQGCRGKKTQISFGGCGLPRGTAGIFEKPLSSLGPACPPTPGPVPPLTLLSYPISFTEALSHYRFFPYTPQTTPIVNGTDRVFTRPSTVINFATCCPLRARNLER